jgi:hypothetical protein
MFPANKNKKRNNKPHPHNREQPPPDMFSFHRNIVATVNLGTRLDLKKIALQAKNAEYNPKVSGRRETNRVLGMRANKQFHAMLSVLRR